MDKVPPTPKSYLTLSYGSKPEILGGKIDITQNFKDLNKYLFFFIFLKPI